MTNWTHASEISKDHAIFCSYGVLIDTYKETILSHMHVQNQLTMVDLKPSFAIIWLCILFSTLHETWCRPKEAHRNGASSLNFMVVGDWGGQDNPPYYTDPEKDVAKQMGEIAGSMGAQFTLSMGDNFYDSGVIDVDDPRFKETFEVPSQTAWKQAIIIILVII